MEIVLREKIHNLGNIGDIVNVKHGFARNFLIPGGKAVPATKANIAEVEAQRAELEKTEAQALKAAQDHAAKIEGLVLELPVKVTEEGKLYGSIGVSDIAIALTEAAKFDVGKKQVQLPEGPIHELGEFDIHIAFHGDVVANVKIKIIEE